MLEGKMIVIRFARIREYDVRSELRIYLRGIKMELKLRNVVWIATRSDAEFDRNRFVSRLAQLQLGR